MMKSTEGSVHRREHHLVKATLINVCACVRVWFWFCKFHSPGGQAARAGSCSPAVELGGTGVVDVQKVRKLELLAREC